MSGHNSSGSVQGSIKFAGEEAKDKMYEPKDKKKAMRVLTVIAYVFSVSLAAIMLSMYYLFLWQPQKSTVAQVYNTPPECGSGNLQTADLNRAHLSIQNYANQEQMIAETPRVLPQRIEVTSPMPDTTGINIDYEDTNFTLTNTDVTVYS